MGSRFVLIKLGRALLTMWLVVTDWLRDRFDPTLRNR